jgi:PAS domain S-box-containing protein
MALTEQNLLVKQSMNVATQNKNSKVHDKSGDEGPEGLHVICDALPVLMAQIDSDERYCFNNRAYESWFGLKRKQLYGRTVREVLGDDTYKGLQSHIQKAFLGEKQTFESTVRHRDGTNRSVQIDYVPRFSNRGIVDGIYILTTDITDRQETEAQILKMNAELERRVLERTAQLEAANKELEAFCYSVSHDLRAPLRAVRGFSEVLIEQYAAQLDARGQDFLRRVNDASSQMDRLVDDLLRLSRISRSEIRTTVVDLKPIAEEIISALKKEDPSRNVEILFAPDLNAYGDERLLRLVLDNLLRNAWKFTGKKAEAKIEFGRTADDATAFFIRDNGAGFDMTYANRLFGVFQRLHSPSDFPGSGVGLAIVQRVINRHGGRVWAEAAVNAGATFYFTLPSPP